MAQLVSGLLHTGELNMKMKLFLNTFSRFMGVKNLRQSILRWSGALFVALSMAACATGQELVSHSFGFDLRYDNQDAQLLDYRYGARNSRFEHRNGH